MTRRTTTANKRGKKERLLRYLLRRKPCAIITVVEVSLFVTLGLLLAILVYFNQSLDQQMEDLRREDAVLQNYSQKITFSHCDYKAPGEFNTDFCKNRCGATAFMWRHHQLVVQNNETLDRTCLDRHEQIDCIKDTYDCKVPFPQIPQCGGLFNVSMPKELITSEYDVIAPVINVSNHLGGTLLAQEVFVKCPRCRVLSHPFKYKDNSICRRKLHTIRRGWPYRMELCDDDEIMGEETKCSTV